MKSSHNGPNSLLLKSAFLSLSLVPLFFASTVDGAPVAVGYHATNCPSGADTVVSNSFHRTPAHSGSLVADASTDVFSGRVTFELSAVNIFELGDFSDSPHYIRIADGPLAGITHRVAFNNRTSVSIDPDEEEIFSTLTSGTSVEIIPCWTLASLFPRQHQKTIHRSTNKLDSGRKTTVLFFNHDANGINRAPNRIFFLTAEGWFEVERNFPSAGNLVIAPDQPFVIRHPLGEPDTKFFTGQVVLDGPQTVRLKTSVTETHDNVVSIKRPLPFQLDELTLADAFTDSASTAPQDRADELFLFDNVTAAVNKTPAASYFRVGGNWVRDNENDYPNANSTVIPSSTGFIIRKISTATGNDILWKNLPNF